MNDPADRIKKVGLIILFLFLGSCALSPQTININPDIRVQDVVGQSQTVQVTVVDERESPVLGQRGGVYKDTSNIITSDNMTDTLRKSLEKALQKQGYSVAEQEAGTRLTVSVNKMTYKVHTEELLNKIEIAVDVRMMASKNGREFTGDYKTNRKKDYVKLPGADENEKIINETLASVLNSMLSDDDLVNFIKNQ